MHRGRWLVFALLVSVLAAPSGIAADNAPDLEPVEARGEGPLHADEPARVVVRIANHAHDAPCPVSVAGALAGRAATAGYAHHAARSAAEVTLEFAAVPAGTHDLRVEVTAGQGCQEGHTANNVRSFPLAFAQRPAVAAALAASAARVRAPADVVFSLDAAGATSWSLDFGDGASTSGTGAPPATLPHLYGQAGAFTARLTARNGSATAQATAVVLVDPPASVRAVALRAAPAEGRAPLLVTFTVEGGQEATAWRLEFGDGAEASGEGPPPTTGYTYRTPGRPVARLLATFPDGEAEAVRSVRVLGGLAAAPAVHLTAAVRDGTAPLAVEVAAAVTPAPSSWRMVWGDGAESSGSGAPGALRHTFALPGEYRAVFEAVGADGARNASSISFAVAGASGLQVGAPHLAAHPAAGEAPLRVEFSAGCTCRDVLSWRLDFGDGTAAWGEGAPPVVPHTYLAGRFSARLSLQTLRGPVEAAPVTVEVAGPSAPRLLLAAAPGELAATVLAEPGSPAAWELELPGGAVTRGVGEATVRLPARGGTASAQLRVDGLTVDRGSVEVPSHPAPLLLAEPAAGSAPLPSTLRLRYAGPLLHWAVAWGDGAVESGAGAPPDLLHRFGPGRHEVRLTAVTLAGEVLDTAAAVEVAPTSPRLDFSPRPGVLEVRAGEGTLTFDGAAPALFADAGLTVPAEGGEGTRYLPCPPGDHVLRLVGPWGATERAVRCAAATEAGRRDLDFGGPEGATVQPIPLPASAALLLLPLAAALRGRRGAALLLVAVLAAGLAEAHVVRNTSWSRMDTAAGDHVRVDGISFPNLRVTAPDGSTWTGSGRVDLPPGLPADGSWEVLVQTTCPSEGWTIRFAIAGFSDAVTAGACVVLWKFQPEHTSRFRNAVVGGVHQGVVGGGAGGGLRDLRAEWFEVYTYHPWGPPDYELYLLNVQHAAAVASATDYDEDGRPNAGELATGTCLLSPDAACPQPEATGAPEGLAATLAFPRGAFAGVADRARLTVTDPDRAPITAVDLALPQGWALDLAASEGPAGWNLRLDGPVLRAAGRQAPQTEPVFDLALTPPGPARTDRFEVYAGNAAALHPGRSAAIDVPVRVDAAAPQVSHDAPAWASGRRDVRLVARDDGAGLANLSWRLDGGPWTMAQGAQTLVAVEAAAPATVLSWRAADRAGNLGQGQATIRRDADPPLLAWTVAPGMHDGPVTVSATATDAESGVATVGVRRPGGPLLPAIELSTEGEHELEAVAVDAAGNEARAGALHLVAFPGAAALTATVDPAAPRPGEPALVTLRLENLRDYALSGAEVALGGERAALGDIPAHGTAFATFSVSREEAATLAATAAWRTPWREERSELAVPFPVAALRALELTCLPVAGPPGAATVPCAAFNRGDVAGEVRLAAGGAAVRAQVAPGAAALLHVPVDLPPGRGVVTVRADGAPGEAAVEVAVAGVRPRALLLDGGEAVNAGAVAEEVAAGRLAPQARAPAAGSVVALDGAAGAAARAREAPPEILARSGPLPPAERGAGLAAVREEGRVLVRDAEGPLPGAVVLSGGSLAATDAAGAAAASGPVTVRYGSWRIQV